MTAGISAGGTTRDRVEQALKSEKAAFADFAEFRRLLTQGGTPGRFGLAFLHCLGAPFRSCRLDLADEADRIIIRPIAAKNAGGMRPLLITMGFCKPFCYK